MVVDAISFDERQKRLKDGACFICAEKGHFSGQCPKRKEYREQRAQWKPQRRPQGQGKPQGRPQGKPQGKGKMDPRTLRTHIRATIVDNIGDDPDQLHEFMDLVDEEGF